MISFDDFITEKIWVPQTVISKIKSEVGQYLQKLTVLEHDNFIELNLIVVKLDARGQGILNRVMSNLIQYSEQVQKPLVLYPDESQGTSEATLREIYKKFGFKNGKRPYFDAQGEMVREF